MILFRPNTTTFRQASTIWCSRTGVSLRCRNNQIRHQHIDAESSRLPRIAQSSIWESVFPKSLRTTTKEVFRPSRKGPINPQKYFIWIYILIGSQAIRILGLQNDFNAYMRKAELRIDRLRQVVEKLQKGEPVDVEKVLGTGDEAQELEWEDALREIEDEERLWQENRRRRQEEQTRLDAAKQDASPVNQTEPTKVAVPDLPSTLPRPPSQPGFY